MKTLLVEQVSQGLDTTVVPAVQKWMYKVTKVTNSIAPAIHDMMSAAEVDVYCEAEEWEVTIK
jgi:hypothetical protein